MNPATSPSATSSKHTTEPLRWLRVQEAANTHAAYPAVLCTISFATAKSNPLARARKATSEAFDSSVPRAWIAYIEAHVLPWYSETKGSEAAVKSPDG